MRFVFVNIIQERLVDLLYDLTVQSMLLLEGIGWELHIPLAMALTPFLLQLPAFYFDVTRGTISYRRVTIDMRL